MPYKNISDRQAFLKRWREKNRDILLKKKRAYYLKNKDKIKKRNKEAERAYYLENREKILARAKAFRVSNPNYMKEYDQARNVTQLGRLRIMFKGITKRIRHRSSYKHRKLCFTYQQFVDRFLQDGQFRIVFDQWVKSGYKYQLCPSLDRIDNDGDYTLDNVQIISLSANSSKKRKKML